jgi:glyoxylase-like metal-dependent hydrolase (beta-lactamase superfamily II)
MVRTDEPRFVESRRLGDATVTAISDGAGYSTVIKALMVPEAVWRQEVEANDEGEVLLGFNVCHVRIGDASILIDTGFDDPSPSSPWMPPKYRRSPGVQAGLAALGIPPDAVTHVLITHAHGDHIAGATVERAGARLPRYPNATYYIGRADWEGNPAREQAGSLVAVHLGTLARLGQLELVDAEHEIVPGVTMLPAPGETPGHCIVRVRSGGESFYFLGDLFHHPVEVTHLDWVSRGRDLEQMVASRRRLVEQALAEDALLMTAHMPFPAFGRIRRADGSVRWEPM